MDVFLISLAALLFGGMLVIAADVLRSMTQQKSKQINDEATMRQYRKMFE